MWHALKRPRRWTLVTGPAGPLKLAAIKLAVLLQTVCKFIFLGETLVSNPCTPRSQRIHLEDLRHDI